MRITLICLLMFFVLFAQAQKEVWKKTSDGDLQIVYHSNGKVSTEILFSNKTAYFEQGYAKAFDRKGNLIYEKPVSRTAMISSVFFKYYDNGAVKSAEFSSHPDAGIQWYKEWTTFNDDGTVADVQKQSHDDTALILIPQKDQEEILRMEKEKALELARKDSSDFYREYSEPKEGSNMIEVRKAYPLKSYRETSWYIKKKCIRTLTEYYRPNKIIKIEREFWPNGKMKLERICEKQICHLTLYDKRGKVLHKESFLPVK